MAPENWGFVSESVVKLKLIDGKGEIFECGPSDDLFKAAIGGIGAVGIILEVVVQGVDRFNVDQITKISDLSFVEDNLERLLAENDHFSLYLFPFTTKCQINTWNRTSQGQSLWGNTARVSKHFNGCLAGSLVRESRGLHGTFAHPVFPLDTQH